MVNVVNKKFTFKRKVAITRLKKLLEFLQRKLLEKGFDSSVTDDKVLLDAIRNIENLIQLLEFCTVKSVCFSFCFTDSVETNSNIAYIELPYHELIFEGFTGETF